MKVTKKSLKNLKKFKKGQSGNPLGGQRHDPIKKELKRLTSKELERVGAIVIKGDRKDLEAIFKNKESTLLELMTASISQRIIYKGDVDAWNLLLDRLIGKVATKIEATGKDGTPLNMNGPQVIVTLPSNGREAKTIEAQKKLSEPNDQ